MARLPRLRISSEDGSYHVISRIVGQQFLLDAQSKDYFLNLLKICSSVFFVKLHAFCIMDNHFHLLVSEDETAAKKASSEDLQQRYRLLSKLNSNGLQYNANPESLRQRYADISHYVQEIKQRFSRWYNCRYKRKGYLWSERFKGVLISRGKAQVDVSAYIELNPVRAGVVKTPEEYRWSSYGCEFSSDFVVPSRTIIQENDISEEAYKDYLYDCGGIDENDDSKSNGDIDPAFAAKLKNFSCGVVLGTFKLVENIQQLLKRSNIKPRALLSSELYVTRVYRST